MTDVHDEPAAGDLRVSSRDPAHLRTRLEAWFAAHLPAGAAPVVTEVGTSSATGLSSDTVLFVAEWTGDDGRRSRRDLVARIAPDPKDVPVFPSYDLDRQFRVIDDVGRRSSVPVPPLYRYEPDDRHVGAPFFVMARVDGVVPPDVMPYTFGDNWLHDARPDDRARLQQTTLALLAELHAIAVSDDLGYLDFPTAGATPLRRHVAHTREWYEWVAAESGPSPLIERTFAWLDDHWPEVEGPPVVSWGDARIGNILYADFEPVAVLDWEMAGLGPRELDLAWLVYSHRVFQDLAHALDAPGLPDLLRADDVCSAYERTTGHPPRRLDFYGTYAAVQWAIVFVRTARRSFHFGERTMPDHLDDVIMNRDAIEQMLAGTYWA